MTLHPAPELLTIAPENLWVKVEGRCIGPITAPPGSPDFADQFRQMAAQITAKPPEAELQALKVGGIAALEDDLSQLHRLLGVAQDLLEDPADRVALNALSALLWTLRDKTEVMGWKAGELCKAHPDIAYPD